MSLQPPERYLSSLRRLSRLERFGSKPGLARIKRLLDALGNPQNNFKCILVAGTNGKGSTTAMLASILSASGKKTGSYFSPPIFSACERIQINGRQITHADFARICNEVLDRASLIEDNNDPLTHFEALTAMALLHFSRKKVDCAVLEAGLGGRLDASNAAAPALSIITSIGLEHTQVLGKTTTLIAAEKAGIMRAGVPVVCSVSDAPALAKIKSISRSLGAPLTIVRPLPASRLPLLATGSFQRINASCAASAARLLGVPTSLIKHTLSSFSMPARWQKISSSPRIIIDCCHNPPAARAIQPDLCADFPRSSASSRVLLFAAMQDKDYSSVLPLLAPHFEHILLCRPPLARAAKLNDLKKAALHAAKRLSSKVSIVSISNPALALAEAKLLAGKKGRILICGSIYLLQFLFGEREG